MARLSEQQSEWEDREKTKLAAQGGSTNQKKDKKDKDGKKEGGGGLFARFRRNPSKLDEDGQRA